MTLPGEPNTVPAQAESAHARYRGRLEALAAPGAVAGEVAAALPALSGRRDWRYRHTRFDPGCDAYATLLLESREGTHELVRVEAHEACPPVNGEIVVRAPGTAWLSVARFPDDTGLATLPALLEGPGVKTVVRYRPLRRCTLRVDLGGQVRFAKVFADQRGERAYADAVAVHEAARRGELGCAVPRPLGFDARTRTLWQEALPGSPVAPLLYSRAGGALARRIGAAAASLTQSGLAPRRTFDRDAQLARSLRQCADLQARVPTLAPDLAAFREQMLKLHRAVPIRSLRPVHRALEPAQWLVTSDGLRLGLVDFDTLALGDPELDVATFLAEVDNQNPRRVPIEELGGAFLAGYESVAGPLDDDLIRLYRAQRRVGKALRASWAVRPDGDRRAGQRLGRAIRCLQRAER